MSLLITFKSKAAAEFIMYKSHVNPIFELLGKDPERGVLTPAELPAAIAKIEANIAATKEAGRPKPDNVDDEDDEARRQRSAQVSTSTRLFPLLEMLRAANEQQRDVVWGV
jgi:hypothetical protein